ncbi:unnamed protein product [Rotaria sp. Silwood1]|nr:unnamed protein product [Rotaria sp. Silwood1]
MDYTSKEADEFPKRNAADDISQLYLSTTVAENRCTKNISNELLPDCQGESIIEYNSFVRLILFCSIILDPYDQILNDLVNITKDDKLVKQKSWITKNNTSEIPYEFRLGEVDHHEALSLYLSLLCGPDCVDFISARHLRNNVASCILQSKDINIDCALSQVKCKTREEYCNDIKQGAILNGLAELNALASLYPKYLFCVISKTTNDNGDIFINVATYVKDISSYKKCNLSSTVTLISTSETTQEFFRKPVPADGNCLFSSLSNVLDCSKKITIEDLRNKAAEVISQSHKIDEQCLLYETGKSRDQYCSAIRDTNAWGGHPEIEAIAESYETIIRVVDVHSQPPRVSISEFPSKKTSFDRCCYIIRQNKHYESLHLRNGNNSNGERVIFNSNDKKIKELICDFIEKEFPTYKLESCDNKINGDELPVQPVEKSFDKLPESVNLIRAHDTKKLTKKRKLPKDDGNSSIAKTTKKLSSSNLSTNEVNIQSSTESCLIPLSDSIHVLDANNNLLYNIKELFQTDFPQIQFKIHPAKHFRTRTLSDYEPKNEYKRDGKTKSQRRCPTYFADRHDENDNNKRHSLTLLIPKMLVFGQDPIDLHRVKVEICIVTRTINRCIYIHPYYKFYKPEKGREYSVSNPIFIHLGYDTDYENLTNINGNLTEINGILNMDLYLAVIHILNNDLEKLGKPLQPFESLESNGIADTTIYNKSDVMKKKFHLYDLRFAITLWIKQDDKEEYQRHVHLQYISEISTGQPQLSLTENQQ